MYKRLTLTNRYQIEGLLSNKLGMREIARRLKRSPSSISREIRRIRGKYAAIEAHKHCAEECRRRDLPKLKITDALKRIVDRNLKRELSPEQLSAMLLKERGIKLSHHAIYRYIEKDRLEGGRLKYKLRILKKQRKDRKRPKYRSCEGLVRERVPITKRPKIVERKIRLGDFERDTVLGKRGGPLFLTIVERKSGYLFLKQVRELKARTIHHATVRALRHERVETITNDNGVEFAFHKKTARELKTEIYFSRSYAAWERGANENLNGLLRQYFPRKKAIPRLTPRQVRAIEKRLNTRPRKRLGYKTPWEVYHGKPHGQVLR